jgi:ferric-dicitrate binding protein FerR (iron transport regulator)
MTRERFIELFDKSQSGYLSESEAIEWNEWIGRSVHNREMIERIQDEEYRKKIASLLAKARLDDWQNIIEKHPELRPEGALVKHLNNRRFIQGLIAAAVVIILIVSTIFWFINNKGAKKELATTTVKEKVQAVAPPEMNKARITLGNGDEVALDTLTDGVLAMQGEVNVVKASDGQISYKGTTGKQGSGKMAYNTLTNPRGSKIVSINLSDGTKIWLNSESSLRYPVVFNGNERRVELTGEAYFEVAPSFIRSGKKRPFYVTANNVTVEVLGTHYNVNSYTDESTTKVTLLEGSVKVKLDRGGQHSEVVIKPGEQATISQTSQTSQSIPVQTADLDRVMAWKNNTFYFDGESLDAIMKQLARFYNVEVEYEGNIPDKRFGGMISRNKNLNEVLSVLELSGIHFRMEGKKIIVLK